MLVAIVADPARQRAENRDLADGAGWLWRRLTLSLGAYYLMHSVLFASAAT